MVLLPDTELQREVEPEVSSVDPSVKLLALVLKQLLDVDPVRELELDDDDDEVELESDSLESDDVVVREEVVGLEPEENEEASLKELKEEDDDEGGRLLRPFPPFLCFCLPFRRPCPPASLVPRSPAW